MDELTPVLTPADIIKAKEKELSELHKTKVIAITIDAEGDLITGYFKNPSYDMLLYCTDCMTAKETSKGGEAMIQACLIPEESDKRILDKENNPIIASSFVVASLKLYKIFASKKN